MTQGGSLPRTPSGPNIAAAKVTPKAKTRHTVTASMTIPPRRGVRVKPLANLMGFQRMVLISPGRFAADWGPVRCHPRLLRMGPVKSASRRRCTPVASKLDGSNYFTNTACNAGHSASMAANQAVSRLLPLCTMAWRKTPSKDRPRLYSAGNPDRMHAASSEAWIRLPSSFVEVVARSGYFRLKYQHCGARC